MHQPDKASNFAVPRAQFWATGLPRAAPGAFIIKEDIDKLYRWFAMTNPTSLLYKVWFDVAYYFLLNESDLGNIYDMQRDSFVVRVDQNKRRYVTLKDQQRFSGLTNVASHSNMELRMYEISGSLQCPVASLLAYVERLHPVVKGVWQRPREAYRPSEPGIWYDMFPLGISKLARMMPLLSRQAGLSAVYRACHIRHTALCHLELAGVGHALLRELRGRGRRRERGESGPCRPEGEICCATSYCRQHSAAAWSRRRKLTDV